MSRGIRDLRDLICVSRLTIRDSDDEINFSSDEDSKNYDSTNSLSQSSGLDSRQGSASSEQRSKQQLSPDSGVGTNGHSHESLVPGNDNRSSSTETWTSSASSRPQSTTKVGQMRRKKKKKIKISQRSFSHDYDLPKQAVLPPVNVNDDILTSSNTGSSHNQSKLGDFDGLLTYMDATVLSEWLLDANAKVTDIASWCHTSDNFVQFAHFWLSDFSELQKQQIFKLETDIVLDHLSFAFETGRQSGKVKHKDLVNFLDAVFREYPGKLFSVKGPYMFLDVLMILSSERKSLYKELLANVKVSTRVKQHAQWCLAVRSFTLVSVWTAVINFYRQLLPQDKRTSGNVPLGKTGQKDCTSLWAQHSIRNGFVDVLDYFIGSGKVKTGAVLEHSKSLVFTAVMYKQPDVLHYLLTQTDAKQHVNEAADTGNTPLHAAANIGNSKLVKILLELPEILVNVKNPHCDNAMPIHLATMHGHVEVVKQLLLAGADIHTKMGDITAVDIAQDFHHVQILEAFEIKE